MTITETRYGGVYEGGKWAAFDLEPDMIPPDAFGGDPECWAWWDEHGAGVGTGDTPQEAYDALLAIPDPFAWRYRPGRGWYGRFPRTR